MIQFLITAPFPIFTPREIILFSTEPLIKQPLAIIAFFTTDPLIYLLAAHLLLL